MKKIKYLLQAVPIYVLFGFFRLMPLDVASYLGGAMMKKIGPKFKKTQVAEKNLRLSFPEKSEEELKTIMLGMWDNLGRVLGEFPHLTRISLFSKSNRLDISGLDMLRKKLEADKPVLLFSSHMANWEVSSVIAAIHHIEFNRIYRITNNPFVEKLVLFSRRKIPGALMAKGPAGARQLKKLLKEGRTIGMLVDQKFNRGVMSPFLGRLAPCLISYIEFAYDYGYELIPVKTNRLEGARFKVVLEDPIQLSNQGNREKDIQDTLTRINQKIESWIKESPEQWLWIHNRWPKS